MQLWNWFAVGRLEGSYQVSINQDELAICRRRGHAVTATFSRGWIQCTACGMWIREVRTLEEREAIPPLDQDGEHQTREVMAKLNRRLEGK